MMKIKGERRYTPLSWEAYGGWGMGEPRMHMCSVCDVIRFRPSPPQWRLHVSLRLL